MAINIADNFQYQGKKPLDSRTSYATLALMKAVTDSNINEGCLAYCEETQKHYEFKSTNTVDETTGKWREYQSGGGGGASDLSDLGDVDLTSPSDGQVLTYDAETGKWVNAEGGSASVDELGDIGDVDLDNIEDGQTIVWDAENSKWVNATPSSGASELNDLSDVDIDSQTLANGQVLKYNSETGKFENAEGGSTTVDELGDIGDVDLDNIENGQTIVWDATNSKWVNATPSGGDYTAGDGITIENDVISADIMDDSDMDEVMSVLPSSEPRYAVYSTEEQVVGQWIDGKTIYQKTFTVVLPEVTNGQVLTTDTAIGASVDFVIDIQGTIKALNGNVQKIQFCDYSVPKTATSSATAANHTHTLSTVNVHVGTNTATKQNKLVLTSSRPGSNGSTAYITLKYTKTS